MKTSVIIPTYNGEKKIIFLLEALTQQTHKTFEVIVVIDGSSDGTETTVNSFKEKLKELKVLTQPNCGRSITRNNGARSAAGELLIFFDDDMIPGADCIEMHIQAHQNFEKAAVLCGNIVEVDGADKTDIQNYKAHLANKWTARFANGMTALSVDNLFLTAANLSMSKKLFLELGGFDERLNDIEDRELGFRILKQNIPAYFDKSNRAVHNEIITTESYIARVRQYTQAQDKLKLLVPELPNRPTVGFFKKVILYFFSFRIWVRMMDNEILLVHLPRLIRYKIYEWVIFARGVVFATHK